MTQLRHNASPRKSGAAGKIYAVFELLTEICFVAAFIAVFYLVWQFWWTGVKSEQVQNEVLSSVNWEEPKNDGNGSYSIAPPQGGEPPVEPAAAQHGSIVAEMYVPRFGSTWHRNVVQGTEQSQLNLHGTGHYEDTQMPGEKGNFAVAGHRGGYGQPFADVDKFRAGDAIVVRTKNYWFVYKYSGNEIVQPNQTDVLSPVPHYPGKTADNYYITLTTCHPKYGPEADTQRWIAYGQLSYWAKVSDGIPGELATTDSSGKTKFTQNGSPSIAAHLPELSKLFAGLMIFYAVLHVSAAIAWQYPALRRRKRGKSDDRPLESAAVGVAVKTAQSAQRTRSGSVSGRGSGRGDERLENGRRNSLSFFSLIARIQPGVKPVRIIENIVLILAAITALFEWFYPWAATSIPYLSFISHYVSV